MVIFLWIMTVLITLTVGVIIGAHYTDKFHLRKREDWKSSYTREAIRRHKRMECGCE